MKKSAIDLSGKEATKFIDDVRKLAFPSEDSETVSVVHTLHLIRRWLRGLGLELCEQGDQDEIFNEEYSVCVRFEVGESHTFTAEWQHVWAADKDDALFQAVLSALTKKWPIHDNQYQVGEQRELARSIISESSHECAYVIMKGNTRKLKLQPYTVVEQHSGDAAMSSWQVWAYCPDHALCVAIAEDPKVGDLGKAMLLRDKQPYDAFVFCGHINSVDGEEYEAT